MKLALDYTDRARPLSMHHIKSDLDNYYAKFMIVPDKIIMWEYQLDWLIKRAGGIYKVPSSLAAGVRIWSTSLEIRGKA